MILKQEIIILVVQKQSKYYNGGTVPKKIQNISHSKRKKNNYQQQIGSLIYLTTFTRPNLAYSVNYLARFMSNPSIEHYKALNYLQGYINKTKNYGLDLTLQSF